MRVRATLLLTVLAGCAPAQSGAAKPRPKVALDSSDARLVAAFNWAKRQALAYAFEGDPVGPWYEAALPGREAFCMRDVSHQAMGAHALGLALHTRNMLHRFAENISESKDWCSYWEIDRHNRPAPVDYTNDAEFWYNLPANFDVLDCCYRMFVWSGDPAYLNDPVFLNFYDRTVADYVERWNLGLDRVMTRRRSMNVREPADARKRFQRARGIPGYDEGNPDYVLGVDLLDAQYAAYLAYSRLQELRGNRAAAQSFSRKAADVRALVNTTFWNDAGGYFYSHVGPEHKLEGRAGQDLLYRDVVVDGPKARAALDTMLEAIRKDPSGAVEGQSHQPEILYRCGVPDVAYSQMMDLAREGRARREYPEVSFSVIGAIVTGLMGITVIPPSPLQAADGGGSVDRTVRTLPGLGTIAWAEIRDVPIGPNEVGVRHEGSGKTVFTNRSGPALVWQAAFEGSHQTLLVDGKPVRAKIGKLSLGRMASSVTVTVGAGVTAAVEVPK